MFPENINEAQRIIVEAVEKQKSEEPTEPRNREWTAIRGECVSGGQLTADCNLVAASQGKAEIEVVLKKLSCGCLLVPADSDEEIIL